MSGKVVTLSLYKTYHGHRIMQFNHEKEMCRITVVSAVPSSLWIQINKYYSQNHVKQMNKLHKFRCIKLSVAVRELFQFLQNIYKCSVRIVFGINFGKTTLCNAKHIFNSDRTVAQRRGENHKAVILCIITSVPFALYSLAQHNTHTHSSCVSHDLLP